MNPGVIREPAAASHLLPHEIAFGLLMASTSGAAVLAHTFGPVPLSLTAPFVVVPTSSVLIILILLRQRLYQRLHFFTERLVRGGVAGFLATLAYDAVRPPLVALFQFTYHPFRAILIFGQLITGLPPTDLIAQGAGWVYHFWNGITFGMMFALVRPRGGVIAGWLWGMILEGLMMAAYPHFLQVRLEDPGFLVTSIVGHSLWGIVLGLSLRKWGRHG